MRFKRFCSLSISAAIGMSILAGTAAAKETTTGVGFDFNQNDGGFTPIFSDYPNEQGVEEFYELRSGHEEVPIADAGKGLFLSGNNHSDDLFMGYFKELSGLAPETEYQFTVRFKLATNVENDMIGIGGAPGESVFVKCGVASEEPENSLDSLNHFRLNIDKGSQSTGGADMIVVGNLAKKEINRPGEYEFNEIETKVIARTDEAGTAYLVIGTDSGFEGVTSHYLDDISVSWADTARFPSPGATRPKCCLTMPIAGTRPLEPPPLQMWHGRLLTLRQLPGQSKTAIWAATVTVSLGRRMP